MQKVFINQGLLVFNKILSNLKVNKIFFVIGEKSYKHVSMAISPLIKEIDVDFFTVPDNSINTIVDGCEKLTNSCSDLVVAVGGGRIIDAAKLISTALLSSGNYKNIIKGNIRITSKFLPLLVMPTTAGTGSEATSFSVIYFGDKKYSVASKFLLPDYVIADPLLVKKMPSYLKSCTIFDAFAQAIESFWSIGSTHFSKKHSQESMTIISKNIHEYLQKDDDKILQKMISASYLSGLAINESKTTLPHALSYFLTSKYNIPHGHAVALMFGFIANKNMESRDKELYKTMRDIAKILGVKNNDIGKYWYDLMIEAGLETNLSVLGVKEQDINSIVDSVNIERSRNHPLNINKEFLRNEISKML